MKLTVKKCSAETKCFASIVKLEDKKKLSKKQQHLVDRLINSRLMKPLVIYFIEGDFNKCDKSKIDPEDLAVLEKASKFFPKDEYLIVPIYDIADRPKVVSIYGTSRISKTKENDDVKEYVYSYYQADEHLAEKHHQTYVLQEINGKVKEGYMYYDDIMCRF